MLKELVIVKQRLAVSTRHSVGHELYPRKTRRDDLLGIIEMILMAAFPDGLEKWMALFEEWCGEALHQPSEWNEGQKDERTAGDDLCFWIQNNFARDVPVNVVVGIQISDALRDNVSTESQ
jgi:hypothetical protein